MWRTFLYSFQQLLQRRLNGRFALIFFLTLIGLGVGGYFLHGYQVRRNASAFLRQAQQAEENGQLEKAAVIYDRYLNFLPRDADARVHYVLLVERLAKSRQARQRALFLLQEAYRKAPENPDVRRKLATVQVEFGRFSDARAHLDALLQDAPDDAELEQLRGRCGEGLGDYPDAVEFYERAVRHDPSRVNSYIRLAYVLRVRLQQDKKADEVVRQMVAANPGSHEAHLARAKYVKEYKRGELEEVRTDLAKNLDKMSPQSADVVLLAADLEAERKNLDAARTCLEEGLKHHPKEPRLYQALARVALLANNKEEAIRQLHRGLDQKSLEGHPEAVSTTIDLFLRAGDAAGAESLLGRLGSDSVSKALRGFFEAQMRMREGKWHEARALLERSRTQLDRLPDMNKQANFFLAECYRHLGNPDARLLAARRANEIDPSWPPARREVAEALFALGRLDEAVKGYEVQITDNPSARLAAVRAYVARNLRLPAAERRWQAADLLLEGASAEMKESSEWLILRASVSAWRGQPEEAIEVLEKALKKDPKQVDLWRARIGLELARRRLDKVITLLEEAGKALGDRFELDLLRFRYLLAADKKDEARKVLARLEEKADAQPEVDQLRLLGGVADSYLDLDDVRAAERVWVRLADKKPTELVYRLLLLNAALAEGDDAAAQRWVAQLRQIEGEDGALWRYGEGARLTFQARPEDVNVLNQARTLLAEAAKRRPSWAAVPLADGQLEEKSGNNETAMEQYQRAFDLGERSPELAFRLVRLLTEARRYGEAQAILRAMGDRVAQSSDLRRLAVFTTLLTPDERGPDLERARRTIPADSKDYRDHLLLGQILLVENKPAEAEKALRRAVELAPDKPDPRVSLVAFLAGAKRQKEALAEIADAEKRLPAAEAPLAVAAGYEALDQRDQAEKRYQAALTARPQDARVLRAVASFYLRKGDYAKAEPILHRLLAGEGKVPPAEQAWARRNLALAMAMSGDYGQSQKALALVEQNLKANPNSPEDQRTKAAVLVGQPGRRRDSIRTLESAFRRTPPTPQEQFLLGRLYEAERDWPKAREIYLELLRGKGRDNPAFLAYFLYTLLRNGEVEQAPPWLARLEKVEPEVPRTLELKARLLKAQGKNDEALDLLKKLAGAHDKEPDVQRAVALLLDELNLGSAEAEARFRAYVRLREAEHPEAELELARYLGQHNRLGEALDLCAHAWARCKPEWVAQVCAAILRFGHPGEADFARVEGWLKDALAKNRTSISLALSYADVLDLRGRYEEAEELYRAVLKNDPKNVFAHNNLALLLALRTTKGSEALALIDKALEQVGPMPGLLDTRATVYLALGDYVRATRDFEDALALQSSAAGYFRLAKARLLAGDRSAAREALRKADNSGLKVSQLHPLERSDYQRLRDEIEKQ
jgi:tetratricopeptide (TPR) repeat protein